MSEAIEEMMTQHPVISLVVASFLCFGFVLYASTLTIAPTGGKVASIKKISSTKTPKTKTKTSSRRAKSPLGARRSTRKRTAAKAHNISDVSGQSY